MARDLLLYVCTDPNDTSTGDFIFQRVKDIQFISIWSPLHSGASPRPMHELRLAKAQECDIFLIVVRDRLTSEMETELEAALELNKDVLVFIEERHSLTPHADHIRARCSGIARGFRLPSELGEMCRDDIKELVTASFRRDRSDSAYTLLDSPVKPFMDSIIPPLLVGRRQELQLLRDWMDSSPSGYLFLHGNAGVGKTGLLATFGQQVNAIRVTANNYTGQPELLLASLVQQLAIRLGHSSKFERRGMSELTQRLYEFLLQLGQGSTKLAVIVDGLDQVYDDTLKISFASYLPEESPNNVLFIVSSNNPRLDYRSNWRKIELKPLGRQDVLHYLENLGVPETNRKNLARVVQGSPLFLDLLRRDLNETEANLAKVNSIDDYLASIWRRNYTEAEVEFLTLLAINRGAVARDVACAFMRCDSFTLDRYLTHFRRFLAEGEDGFHLFHNRMRESLNEFLRKRSVKAAHLKLARVLHEDPSLPQGEIPYHLYCAEEHDLLMKTVNEDFLRQQLASSGHVDGVKSIVFYCFKTAQKLSRTNDAIRFAFQHATLVSCTGGHVPNHVLFRMVQGGKMSEALHLVHSRADLGSRSEGYLEIAKALTATRELKISIINRALEIAPKLQSETRRRVLSGAARELFKVDEHLAIPIVEDLLSEPGVDTWKVLSEVLPSDSSAIKVLPLIDDLRARSVRLAMVVERQSVTMDEFLAAYKLIETTNSRALPLLVFLLTKSRHLETPDIDWIKSQLSALINKVQDMEWWSSAVKVVLQSMSRRKDDLLDFHEVEWVWSSLHNVATAAKMDILALLIEIVRSIRPKHIEWLLNEVVELLPGLSLDTMQEALARIRIGVVIRDSDPALSTELLGQGLEAIERMGQNNASLSRYYLLPVAQELMKVDVSTGLALAEKCQYLWQLDELYSRLLQEFFRNDHIQTLTESSARQLLDAIVWTQSFGYEPQLFDSFIKFIGKQPKRTLSRLAPYAVEAVIWSRFAGPSIIALGELASILYPADPISAQSLLGFVVMACNRETSSSHRSELLVRVAALVQNVPGLEFLGEQLLFQGLNCFDNGSKDVEATLVYVQAHLIDNPKDHELQQLLPSILKSLAEEAVNLDDWRNRVWISANFAMMCGQAGHGELSLRFIEDAVSTIRSYGGMYSNQTHLSRLATTARRHDFFLAVQISNMIPDLNYRADCWSKLLIGDLQDPIVTNRLERITLLLDQPTQYEFISELITNLAHQERERPVLTVEELRTIVARVVAKIETWTHPGFKAVVAANLAQLMGRVDTGMAHDFSNTARALASQVTNLSDQVFCLMELAITNQYLGTRALAKEQLADGERLAGRIALPEERVHRMAQIGSTLIKLQRTDWAKDVLVEAFSIASEVNPFSQRVKLQSEVLVELSHLDSSLVERMIEKSFRDAQSSQEVYQALLKSGPMSQTRRILQRLQHTDDDESTFMLYLDRLEEEADVQLDLTLIERAMELGFVPTARAVSIMVGKGLNLENYRNLTREIQDSVRLAVSLSDRWRPDIPGLTDQSLKAALAQDHFLDIFDAKYCLSAVEFPVGDERVHPEQLHVLLNSNDDRPIRAGLKHRLVLEGIEEPRLPSLLLGSDWAIYIPSSMYSGQASGVPLPEFAVQHVYKEMFKRFVDGFIFNGRRLSAICD